MEVCSIKNHDIDAQAQVKTIAAALPTLHSDFMPHNLMQWFFLIIAILFCMIAVNKQWAWYVDFPQCRSFRDQLGEQGFVIFHQSICSLALAIGMFKLLFG